MLRLASDVGLARSAGRAVARLAPAGDAARPHRRVRGLSQRRQRRPRRALTASSTPTGSVASTTRASGPRHRARSGVPDGVDAQKSSIAAALLRGRSRRPFPVGGKTGTTDDFKMLVVGFTTSLSLVCGSRGSAGDDRARGLRRALARADLERVIKAPPAAGRPRFHHPGGPARRAALREVYLKRWRTARPTRVLQGGRRDSLAVVSGAQGSVEAADQARGAGFFWDREKAERNFQE